MLDAAQILGFTAVAAVLVLVPGPNTVLILAHSLAGGRPAGLATVLGVVTGTFVHTLGAALGVSAVVTASRLAYEAVNTAGVGYLLLVGLKELRGRPAAGAGAGPVLDPGRAFRRAVLVSVTNPKGLVFFVAFLPQFVRPERGGVAWQIVGLGLIVAGVGLVVGALTALAADQAGRWLRHPALALWQPRITGAVFLGLGVHLALGS